MSFVKSKKAQGIISWVISISLLIWIGQGLAWDELGKALSEVNYLYLVPLTGVLALHFCIRALRWRYLLPSGEGSFSYRQLFDALMIGNLASSILPLRAGEFVRPYILSKDANTPFAVAFASIVIERFFDLATVLIILAALTGSLPTLPDWAIKGSLGLAFVGGCIFIFMMLSAFAPNLILRITDFSLSFIGGNIREKIKNLLDGLMRGAAVLKNPYSLAMTVLLSAGVWGSVWLCFYVGLLMFPNLASGLLAITLTVVVALAVAAPSAPGFIGVYQTGCVASFVLLGLPKEIAFGYSLIVHAHQFLCTCLYGVFALSARKISLRGLTASK
jgi:uncharacterized protein (TIRG00374 family)